MTHDQDCRISKHQRDAHCPTPCGNPCTCVSEKPTDKQESWRERFDRTFKYVGNRFWKVEPHGDNQFSGDFFTDLVKDFIATELSRVEQEAYERGQKDALSKNPSPVIEKIIEEIAEQSRQSTLEEVREKLDELLNTKHKDCEPYDGCPCYDALRESLDLIDQLKNK